MTEEPTTEVSAAEAFERVRSELSLLRSAIEGLTAARERTPDYTTTLGRMAEDLGSLDARLEQIEGAPALSLSAAALASEINAAAGAARAQDHKLLAEARETLHHALGYINGMINRGQRVRRRDEREWMIGGGGLLAGILLWSILPGAVVRSLPESWGAPEWMAARIMGVDQAEAGQRMIKTAQKAEGQ